MRRQKNYIADLISQEEFSTWLGGQKILLHADTGMGKTTFITKSLLPYCKLRDKKMLILCNRRLLYRQYEATMAEIYRRYETMCAEVAIKTYQELAQCVQNGNTLKGMMREYDVIVADECHYFYADSDFNPVGTYVLLQALVLAAYTKTMIFMTATMGEVKPLLVETFASCRRLLEISQETRHQDFSDYHFRDRVYEFHRDDGNDRFEALILPDTASICEHIAKSEKKSIVFIDDLNKAAELKKEIEKTGTFKTGEIAVLSAEYLENHPRDRIVANLCLTNKVTPRVIITTSVLDNGTSVHDFDVGTVVIATDSEISLKQMLGRVRGEEGQKIKLILYPRGVAYYDKRIEQIQQKLEWLQQIESKMNYQSMYSLLCDGWYGNDEYSEFLRNMVVLTRWDHEYYKRDRMECYVTRNGEKMAMNQFALEKIGNLFNSYFILYKKELARPHGALFEELAWLGIREGEVEVQISSYLEEQKKKLMADLLTINGMDLDELKEIKEHISRTYRKSLLADILRKSGSFATEKLSEICNKFGLVLQKETRFGRTIYTVYEDEIKTGGEEDDNRESSN